MRRHRSPLSFVFPQHVIDMINAPAPRWASDRIGRRRAISKSLATANGLRCAAHGKVMPSREYGIGRLLRCEKDQFLNANAEQFAYDADTPALVICHMMDCRERIEENFEAWRSSGGAYTGDVHQYFPPVRSWGGEEGDLLVLYTDGLADIRVAPGFERLEPGVGRENPTTGDRGAVLKRDEKLVGLRNTYFGDH